MTVYSGHQIVLFSLTVYTLSQHRLELCFVIVLTPLVCLDATVVEAGHNCRIIK